MRKLKQRTLRCLVAIRMQSADGRLPTAVSLAKALRLSRETVWRHLRRLRHAGLIQAIGKRQHGILLTCQFFALAPTGSSAVNCHR